MNKNPGNKNAPILSEEKASTPDNTALPDEILIAEFNYIAQSAFQANEDRARASSFYLVTVGSLIIGILSTQLLTNPLPMLYTAFGLLFIFLALMGLITLFQLARLRHAWYDSARAMNQIKAYYIEHHPGINLEKAFRWNTPNMPKMRKTSSISFLVSMEVCFVGAASMATGVFFLLTSWQSGVCWWISLAAFFIYFFFQYFLFNRLLHRG